MKPRSTGCIGRTAILLILVLLGSAGVTDGQMVFGEKTYAYEPSDVIPGATEFVRKDIYWEAYKLEDEAGRVLAGYVFLSDDLVDIPGYSGHTMNTLIGIDPQGRFTGAKIVRHSEPIVLIGLNERVIHAFVDQYIDKDVRDRVIISDTPAEGYIAIDGITGATVTAVAENATILEAARKVSKLVGILAPSDIRTRRPSPAFTPNTWDGLVKQRAVGAIDVAPEDIGRSGDVSPLELRFAILDPPSVGRNLLGDRYYENVADRLKDGGSALFIGGRGSLSFKGAGFARGGIFDRFTLEQAGHLYVFRDTEYLNHTELTAEGAPRFREGGIFFIQDPSFDPALPFTFHLTIPYRTPKTDKRAYATFMMDYALSDIFVLEEVPFWVTRWSESALSAAGLALLLIVVGGLFAFRQRLLPYRKWLHRSVALVSVVWVGLFLKAQPSSTQILTPVNSALRGKFPFEIFLSEPLIFLFWGAILISLPLWARGYFCGWLCPYGALLELLVGVWSKVAPRDLRERIDSWDPRAVWKWGKYLTFLIILAVATVNLPLAEMLDEVEPFKTFILHLDRPGLFVGYFVLVTLVSMVVHRFFCRFLCPLGGALALMFRNPRAPLVRYVQCTSCKICYRGCEPKAISYETGKIDYRECLQCWDCQSTGTDEEVCPELMIAKKENTVPRVLVSLFLAGYLLVPASVEARTLRVTPGPDAISIAAAESAEGDTLLIAAGTYKEKVVLPRRVVVRGSGEVIVDAGGEGDVLIVAASGTVVEGLTLTGSGDDIELTESGIRVEQVASDVRLIGNTIRDCRFGIWIHGSERAVMIGNRIEGRSHKPRNSRGDGIHLWSARSAEIRENHISDSRDGVYMELSTDCSVIGNTILDSRYSVHTMWCDRSRYNENTASGNLVGLALMFSKKLEAKRNILTNNETHGMLVTQVTRSVVSENVVVGNTKGVFVYNSLYTTIEGNLIARNNMGMHYWGGSEENTIKGNSFVGNKIQVKFVAARDQVWDGNYWSDYVGWDLDSDGDGDVPYRSNTLVDALLWDYPAAKLLLASPAFQVLAVAEREFPVISVPKGVDRFPLMRSPMEYASILERYPNQPKNYYGQLAKLPHIPGG